MDRDKSIAVIRMRPECRLSASDAMIDAGFGLAQKCFEGFRLTLYEHRIGYFNRFELSFRAQQFK